MLQLWAGLAVRVTHLGQQVPQLSLALQVPQPWGVRAGHIHNQVVSQRAQCPDPSHVVRCSIGRALVLAQVDSKGHPRWNTDTAEPGQQDQPPPKGPDCLTREAPGPAKIKTGICSPRVSRGWAWDCTAATGASPQLPRSAPPGIAASSLATWQRLPSETAQLGPCWLWLVSADMSCPKQQAEPLSQRKWQEKGAW